MSNKKLNPDEMYPDNIYKQNYEKLNADDYETGTSLDLFDKANGLERNEHARAEYYHWLSVYLNNPKYFGKKYRNILGM